MTNAITTILLDPTAGAAGFNMVSVLFYGVLLILTILAIIER
jgi:hypothetical protein